MLSQVVYNVALQLQLSASRFTNPPHQLVSFAWRHSLQLLTQYCFRQFSAMLLPFTQFVNWSSRIVSHLPPCDSTGQNTPVIVSWKERTSAHVWGSIFEDPAGLNNDQVLAAQKAFMLQSLLRVSGVSVFDPYSRSSDYDCSPHCIVETFDALQQFSLQPIFHPFLLVLIPYLKQLSTAIPYLKW